MRRIVTTAVAIALVGGAFGAPAVAADRDRPTSTTITRLPIPSERLQVSPEQAVPLGKLSPSQTLAAARRVTSGEALPQDPSATLVLRELWLKRKDLRGAERRQADGLLARPSDGSRDEYGFGYTVREAAPVCNDRMCLHYVTKGKDAPPTQEWPAYNLAVMDSVWTATVEQLGYRAPLADGRRGGNRSFDVYLKNLGKGLYGFCAPEKRVKKRTASGFCVLDDDFAKRQFPDATPQQNLAVTAGHEFFHAVQYAYDYAEDPWMMESTATWMEERIATDVNDNRQYLPDSQIYAPNIPLDAFSRTNSFQYGNWVFWEYLSTQYGIDIVKQAWEQAGSLRKDGGKYSIQALRKVLAKQGGLTKNYARFAAGNLTPAANFPEGAEYPGPRVRGAKLLSKHRRDKRFGTKVNHLASASYVYGPGKGLDGKKWKLRVQVSGPAHRTSPAAVVVVHQLDGTRKVKTVHLNHGGDGRIKVPFDNRTVAAVSVTLVNGSTRYDCGRRTLLACAGEPLDEKLRFAVKGRVTK
jgi:hypothetical protein